MIGWIATGVLVVVVVGLFVAGRRVVRNATLVGLNGADMPAPPAWRDVRPERDRMAEDWLHYADDYKAVLGDSYTDSRKGHKTSDERWHDR